MTIATDLRATITALSRLATTLAQDGDGHRATLITRSLHTLRDCADRAELIEAQPVQRHWLPEAAAGNVVVLATKRARALEEWR